MSSWCLLLEWCDRRGGADGRRRTSGECDCEYDDEPAAEDRLTGERGGEKLIEAERARAGGGGSRRAHGSGNEGEEGWAGQCDRDSKGTQKPVKRDLATD